MCKALKKECGLTMLVFVSLHKNEQKTRGILSTECRSSKESSFLLQEIVTLSLLSFKGFLRNTIYLTKRIVFSLKAKALVSYGK